MAQLTSSLSIKKSVFLCPVNMPSVHVIFLSIMSNYLRKRESTHARFHSIKELIKSNQSHQTGRCCRQPLLFADSSVAVTISSIEKSYED